MAVLQNEYIKAELSTLGASVDALYYNNALVGDKGSIKGRFANRIGGAQFEIGGTVYKLPANEFGNTLHGGPLGFGKREWEEKTEKDAEGHTTAVVYELISEDGDQGFPGTMKTRVRYSLDQTALVIDYEAVCDKDTVINLTNHLYFNLNGIDETADSHDHRVYIDSDSILALDEELVPTGEFIDVSGTRFDFRKEADIHGSYDNCYVMKADKNSDYKSAGPVAILTGTKSGNKMEVYTDCVGVQLYNTDTQVCLEAQSFPDSMHHETFPSVMLKSGETFISRTVYKFI